MQSGKKVPIGLILCAEGNKKQIELLQLDKAGIKVAEYLTELPDKKLHQAIEISKKQIKKLYRRKINNALGMKTHFFNLKINLLSL